MTIAEQLNTKQGDDFGFKGQKSSFIKYSFG